MLLFSSPLLEGCTGDESAVSNDRFLLVFMLISSGDDDREIIYIIALLFNFFHTENIGRTGLLGRKIVLFLFHKSF